jgi:hypothetical protein
MKLQEGAKLAVEMACYRFGHCGDSISRTLRVLFLWWIAMIEIVLWRQEMSSIVCWVR